MGGLHAGTSPPLPSRSLGCFTQAREGPEEPVPTEGSQALPRESCVALEPCWSWSLPQLPHFEIDTVNLDGPEFADLTLS